VEESFAHERSAIEKKIILLKQDEDKAFDKRLHDHIGPLEQQFRSDNASVHRALVSARSNERRLEEKLKKAREAFSKERAGLEVQLVQVKEQNKSAVTAAYEAAQAKERVLLQRQFALDTVALRKKLSFSLKNQKVNEEERETEIAALRASYGQKMHAMTLTNTRLHAAFDEEHTRLRTLVDHLERTKRLSLGRMHEKAAARLELHKKTLDRRFAKEAQDLRARMLELGKKRKELELNSKQLRSGVALQRETLRKKLEEATATLKAQQHATDTAIEQKKKALRTFCWRLHTRVLLLEKREKLLAQKEVKLQETLGREHGELRKQLAGVADKKNTALTSARSQAQVELDAHKKELGQQFTQREQGIEDRSRTLRRQEMALEAEKQRMHALLDSERRRLRAQFEKMKARVSVQAAALQKRATEQGLTLASQEKIVDKYREKIASRFSQRNVRLHEQFAALEDRERKLTGREAALHAEACNERAALDEKIRHVDEEKKAEIGRVRADAQKSLEDARKGFAASFQRKVAELKQKMHEELRSALAAIKTQNEASVHRELAQKEKEIRPRLELEYQRKLKIEVRKHMVMVRRRKLDFERQIIARTREFVG
jgi:hypothetical protein